MISDERWRAAQESEAAFHRGPWSHVSDEVRAGARGLLRIAPYQLHRARVLDVGCGPRSILLDPDLLDIPMSRVALDPLDFGSDIEKRYDDAGIDRVITPIERYFASDLLVHFNEVWCYNTLQHVLDVDLALRHMQQLAMNCVRLFEWVDVPETVNHPHVLAVGQLRGAFDPSTWRARYEMVGMWSTPDFSQRFYAAIFDRRAP